jgi:hypothetical protein
MLRGLDKRLSKKNWFTSVYSRRPSKSSSKRNWNYT